MGQYHLAYRQIEVTGKAGTCINSGFIDGMEVKEAIKAVINWLDEKGIGDRKINYRLRDAIFSRQRYWGEPFPIYYKDGMPYPIDEQSLPLQLPNIDKFLPTENGEPPLGHATVWAWDTETKQVVDTNKINNNTIFPLELSTMPGFAGSSGYYLRYMDPTNDKAYFDNDVVAYWQNVDLYVGGAEHASGHLIYSRFWNKFLFDIGLSVKEEPFQKLINQGMIQGRSNFVYRVNNFEKMAEYHDISGYDKEKNNLFVSKNIEGRDKFTMPIHVDINIVDNDVLDIDKFRQWRPEFANAEFVLEDGKYVCGWEVEKMSKSMYNVQNPDDLVEKYGADTLRLYEMFLGPIEQAKPWDTNGIEGVFRFIRKLWRLYHNDNNEFDVSNEPATKPELKQLHQTIKKITDDIERFSFNTAVSTFMICVNELGNLKCNKREILNPLAVLISPFAPHIAEELWHLLGNNDSINNASFPICDESVLVENSFNYPVSFNGKTRFMLELPLDLKADQVQEIIINNADAQKWLDGKAPKKVIFVPKKIINVVI